MTRLILSIFSGLLVTGILSTAVDHVLHVTEVYPPYGQPMRDHGLLALAFVYRAVFAVSGAYVTSLIARERAMKASLILGIIGSILWLAGAIAMWKFAYPWYNILGVATGVPLTLAGARLYMKNRRSAVVY